MGWAVCVLLQEPQGLVEPASQGSEKVSYCSEDKHVKLQIYKNAGYWDGYSRLEGRWKPFFVYSESLLYY